MPQLVTCHKCGTTLYEGEELKPPDQIIQDYDGRCPACNKKLSYLPRNIEVKPIDVPNLLNPLKPQREAPSRTEGGTRTKKRARKSGSHVRPRQKSEGIWGTA
ncbi:MAG: hypothetical protein JSV75_03760 [Candidatus Bathyarchaeota archaeon]|nr:MAG: hypothetical protein JSV75_03760 [Candidatus Bathyarchaeota archaeon]